MTKQTDRNTRRPPAHLRMEASDRGFKRLPEIPSEYGGGVRAYESSAAGAPCIWLKATAPVSLSDPGGPSVEAPLHLSAESAWKLADQLRMLVRSHYQGDARPRGVRRKAQARAGVLAAAAEMADFLSSGGWLPTDIAVRETHRRLGTALIAAVRRLNTGRGHG